MTTTTKSWRSIARPHDNIEKGKVKQNDFAASLADVLQNGGNLDYVDPQRFFDRTYLTAGLRRLAGEVVGRLTGQGDGDPIIQIQTPFGGGKTHTLICLYHLVKHGQECFEHPALKTYWLERGWKVPPSVPVAAFDGNQVGVGAVELESGLSVQTMWGHIAWQLAGKDGYQLVARMDADRVAPGGDDIDKLFQLSSGGLVILDEVANYIEKCAAVAVHDSTLAAQARTFLQTLLGRAGVHERVVVAATLPKSELEYHGTASAEALDRIKKVFGRQQKVREPVAGDEVHEIIRRRLFSDIGKKSQRDKVIQAYIDDLKDRPQIPEAAKEYGYAQRFEQSYPFHPYFLDILNRYVASNAKFQRTRGALRFLALVVADLVKKKHKGGVIHASDVDLTNEEIRSELLELVDREFRSPIEADIIGKGANAPTLDEQSPQMKQWRIASGLATTTFLFTCEAGNGSRGASPAELHLAAARPEIDYGTIPGLIAQIKDRFHFINTEGDRFRFSTTPNLNRILLDARNGIADEMVRERVEAELGKQLAQRPLAPYRWPDDPRKVPDTGSNKLVIMPPEQAVGASGSADAEAAVRAILDKSGSTHRTRRNTLVFVIADGREIAVLTDRVRALLAAENVNNNRSRHNLSKSQVTQLEGEIKNLGKGVRQQVLRAYRHVAWGGNQETPLQVHDMGPPPSGTDKKLTELVVEFLNGKQKYLETLASLLLVHPTKLRVWPTEEDVLSLPTLRNYFRNYTHLPILRDDDVLRTSIADGIRAGQFALAQGTSGDDARVVHFKEEVSPSAVFLEDGYVLLRQNLAEAKLAATKDETTTTTPPITTTPGTGAGSVAQPGTSVGGGTTTTAPPVVGETGTGEPVGGDGKSRRVRLDVEVPYTDFHTFYTGIINALGRAADRISINVQVEASCEQGFTPTLIEDTVKETLFNLFRSDDALEVD